MPHPHDGDDLASILEGAGSIIGGGLAQLGQQRRQAAQEKQVAERQERLITIQKRQADIKLTGQLFSLGNERDDDIRTSKFNALVTAAGGDPKTPENKQLLKIFSTQNQRTLDDIRKSFTAKFKTLEPGQTEAFVNDIFTGRLSFGEALDQGRELTQQRGRAAAFAPTPGLPGAAPGGAVSRAEAAQRLRGTGMLEEARDVEAGARREAEGAAGLEATRALTAQRRRPSPQRAVTRTETLGELQVISQGIAGKDFKPTSAAGKALFKIKDPAERQQKAETIFNNLIKADPLQQMLRQSQISPAQPTPQQPQQGGVGGTLNRLFGDFF